MTEHPRSMKSAADVYDAGMWCRVTRLDTGWRNRAGVLPAKLDFIFSGCSYRVQLCNLGFREKEEVRIYAVRGWI